MIQGSLETLDDFHRFLVQLFPNATALFEVQLVASFSALPELIGQDFFDRALLSDEAIERARDILVPHGVYPLRFWRAWERDELVEVCKAGLAEVDGLVIKPFQGSGGCGVLPILEDSSVPEVVENSPGEFHAKYGHRYTPFPYTVCEKINPRKAVWRGQRHNYDIRIYVARQGDMLIPVGCLFRLAPQPDKGTYSKDSLIVNLSGYGGIAIERGLGLIRENLDTVRLEEEDIVKIFAASTLLMAAITRQPIDWSQRQPR
jgi:hypothetical protein